MKDCQLKDKLKAGEVVLGTWTVISSPTLTEIMGSSGLDFIIIDHEHGPFNFDTSENMIRAAENVDCTPLIRVPENNQSYILRALEIGSHGILIPQIENKKEASYAVDSIYYSPKGNRGVSAFTRASNYNAMGVKGRNIAVNDKILSIEYPLVCHLIMSETFSVGATPQPIRKFSGRTILSRQLCYSTLPPFKTLV